MKLQYTHEINLKSQKEKLLSNYRRAIESARPVGKHGNPSWYALAQLLDVSPQYITGVLKSDSLTQIEGLYNKIRGENL